MRVLLALATLGLAAGAQAETLKYSFDKVHSQIHASVTHLGFSNSTARFHIKDGSLELDLADLSAGKVDVTIDVNSMDLGDATWKDHLSGEKWFNLAAHPEARFVSTKVSSSDGKSLTVDGDLTLRGVTKPVTLQATLNGSGAHPFSKKPALGFSATTRFKRSDFGISEYVPAVGDEVSVRIEIEASAN